MHDEHFLQCTQPPTSSLFSLFKGFLLKFQLELHGTAERMIGRRMERAVVQQCAVRNSDGGCEGRLLHYSFPEFSLQ